MHFFVSQLDTCFVVVFAYIDMRVWKHLFNNTAILSHVKLCLSLFTLSGSSPFSSDGANNIIINQH